MLRYFHEGEEIALKAKEIIDNSFRVDRKNTKFVAPAKLELTKKGYLVTTITKIPGQRARTHKVNCNMEDGYEGPFKKGNVKLDCDCSRYLFVWNAALLKYDAAIKDRTNGESPVQTNPAEIPGCCVDGDSLITTSLGNIPLRDIKIGNLVETLEGFHKVIEHVNMGIKPTIKLFFQSGRELICTPDHRILVLTFLNGTDWKEAKDVCFNRVVTNCLENSGFDLVVDIQPYKSIEVFDIGVENVPHFFSNGICTHNCKHLVCAMKLLMQKNPYWSKTQAAKSSHNAIPLTNLDTMLKRIRRGRV